MEVEPAVEAKDAVMGERQVVKVTEVEEEVTKTVIEKNSSGKYVEKEVTETVTNKTEEPQYEEVPLYHANGQPKKDDDGNPVMHKIPKMEEYEVEPAVKAKAAVTEKRLVSEAVEAVEAISIGDVKEEAKWVVKKDDDGKDIQVKSMKYSVLYMKAVKALQEAMERIEGLEAKVEALENK